MGMLKESLSKFAMREILPHVDISRVTFTSTDHAEEVQIGTKPSGVRTQVRNAVVRIDANRRLAISEFLTVMGLVSEFSAIFATPSERIFLAPCRALSELF